MPPSIYSMQLFWAAASGNLPKVQELCMHPDVDINCQSPDHHLATPLFVACANGHLNVVRHLLAQPKMNPGMRNCCPPPHEEKRDKTPFFIACEMGRTEVVRALLADPKVDPTTISANRSTPLWIAAHKGYMDIVRQVLASGWELNLGKRSDFDNNTAAETAQKYARRDRNETDEDFQRRRYWGPTIATQITVFEANPLVIRGDLRRQLSLTGNLLLVVLLLWVSWVVLLGWLFRLLSFFAHFFFLFLDP